MRRTNYLQLTDCRNVKKDMELQLYPHQQICVEKGLKILREYNLLYIGLKMRLGKSLVCLTIAHRYGAKKVLFLTKKNAIDSIISDHDKAGYNLDLTVTNYEQADKIIDNFDLVILDESNEKISAFPKMGKYAKYVKQICKGKPIIFSSGTATPESFSQLYHQINMSDWSPWAKYTNFYKWAKDYVNKKTKIINGFTVNDYSHGIEDKILGETKHLFVTMTHEEAGIDVEIKDIVHKVTMSDLTKKMIEKIKKDKMIKGKTATYIADTAAKEMQGIHQLGSGTLKVNDDVSITVDPSKVMYIKQHFKGKKIGIFYNYKQEFEMLKQHFDNWTDDDKIFNESEDKVYLGQIVSKRSGVSLRTADDLIFLSTPFSFTSYDQGRARHIHKDRTKPCNVHFLIADCGIDRHVYRTVTNKKKYTTAHYRRDNNGE